MSDDKNYGADVAQTKDRIEGTWTINGNAYDLVAEDVTKGTLDLVEDYMAVAQRFESGEDVPEDAVDHLDNFPWEDENDDTDLIESLLSEKLVKPEIDVSETPVRKLMALFEGMFEAWTEGEPVKSAKAEMPVDGGN